jgi:hypothetical protein
MVVHLSASNTLVLEADHPLKFKYKSEKTRSLVPRKSKELSMATTEQLIALTHKLSVMAQARNTVLETAWVEVPVWITFANADQDSKE